MKSKSLIFPALLLLSAPSYGGLIFTSFGENETAFDISATSVTQPFACQFIAAQSGSLGEIRVALIAQDDSSASVKIEVLSDMNGFPGEKLLDSWNPIILPGKHTITLQSQTHPAILAGEKYWLRLSTEATYLGWFFSLDSYGQVAAWNPVTEGWNAPFEGRLSAFDVSVAPAVCEPSCVRMLIIAAVLPIWIRLKRSFRFVF